MGSTSLNGFDRSLSWDHPHIHGEHLQVAVAIVGLTGSPPYTWGARQGSTGISVPTGITPIYMGSTVSPYLIPQIWQDHPHIHGEHHSKHGQTCKTTGSPPYTWGAPVVLKS